MTARNPEGRGLEAANRLLIGTLAAVQDDLRRDSLGQTLIDLSVDSGFKSARMWSYAKDKKARSDNLVLVGHLRPEPSSTMLKVGMIIDLKRSHIFGDHGTDVRPNVVDYRDPIGVDAETAEMLGLRGSVVVEVPIPSAGRIDGILALELPEDAALDDNGLASLAALGVLIGQRLRLEVYAAEIQLQSLSSESDRNVTQLIAATLELATKEVGAAIGALFEWDPVENVISKIGEYFNPLLDLPSDDVMGLPESYVPGEYLTGKAWARAEDRLVFSFEGIGMTEPEDISNPSLHWHQRILGPVHSVLYGALAPLRQPDTDGARYLIRLMNHVPQASVGMVDAAVRFVDSDEESLKRICERSSSLLEEAELAERLDGIMRFAAEVERDMGQSLKQFENAIRREHISDALIVSWSTDSRVAGQDLLHSLGDVGVGPLDREDDLNLADEATIVRACDNPFQWMSLGSSPIAAQLKAQGYKSVLGVPFRSGDVRGCLLVPSRSLLKSRSRSLRKIHGESKRYLSSCSELLARTIEVRRSEAMAQGALQALGYLGHEMGTPMMQLGSLASVATSRAETLLYAVLRQRALLMRLEHEGSRVSPRGNELDLAAGLQSVRDIQEQIDQKSDFLASLLSLAPIVAMRSDRSLRVNIGGWSIAQIVDDACQRAIDDPALVPAAADSIVTLPWSVRLTAMPSERWDGLFCDRYFLTVAIANLVRNAVKYSFPMPGQTESVIEIQVERQSRWTDFRVVNHGIGVAPQEAQAIFLPFTQGTNYESVRAVRGMGLGLYLCQVIARAHSGSARLLYSNPFSFDDPERNRKLEGFKTAFQMRVSSTLSPGVREVRVDE